MAVVLPKDYNFDLGSFLGQNLAGGFGRARQQGQTQQGLVGLGMSPEEAQQMSMLPEGLLRSAIPGIQKNASKMNVMNQARSMAEALGITIPATATPAQEAAALNDTSMVDSPAEKKVNIYDKIKSDIQKKATTEGNEAMSGFKSYITNLAMTGDPTVASQLTAAQDKSKAAGVRGRESRKTSAINTARAEVKKHNEISDSSRRIFSDYDQIAKAVKASPNKWIAGVPYSILKKFDIEKGVLDPGLALANKAFESQPVQALKNLPGQAARLGKVFESLKNMHGSLQNRPEAIQSISRVKKAEAKIDKIINKAVGKAKSMYIDSDQTPPASLESEVVKSLKPKLEPYLRETEFALSDAFKAKYPEINSPDFKDGAEVRDKDSGTTYKLGKIAGRKAWIVQ